MPTHKSATPPTMMTTGAEDKNDGADQRRETGEPFVDLMAGLTFAGRKGGKKGGTGDKLRATIASPVFGGGAEKKNRPQIVLHFTGTLNKCYKHKKIQLKR